MDNGNGKEVSSRPVGQSASRPVGQSASRPVGQSASRPVGQSASRPVGQSSAFLWKPWLIGGRDSHQSGKRIVRQLAVLLGSAALLLPLAEPVGQRSGVAARYLLAMAATAMATPAQAQSTVTLVSIERQDPTTSPTNADSLKWRITFSGGVASSANSDIETDEFMVSGGTTAMVTNVQTSDNRVFDVTVSGGDLASFNGTVTLGFVASPTIEDVNANTLTNLTPTGTNNNFYVVDNTAPSVSYTAPTTLTVGTAVTVMPSTTDSDASDHSYSVTSGTLPPGLMIDAATGVISGSPTTANSSTSAVTVTVADSASNSATASLIFPAVVEHVNTAPTVANPITDQTAMEGQAFSFTFPDTTFADEDTDDTLSYTAMLSDDSALPTWLSFDDTTRSFSGTPGSGDGGTITVRVTANDGTDDVHDDFEIKVGTVCAEPTFGTRRQIWTGTVTVGGIQEGIHTNWGYNQSATSPGILSDTDFDIGTNNYTITGIYVTDINVILGPGDLSFDLQSATGLTDTEVAALKLHVCDTTPYDFSDATAVSFVEETGYTWDLSLDWSGESTRTLYLSLPANNVATGLPTITSSDGATVGDTLSANQGAIADSDGLPATFPDDYTLQWMREDEDGMNGEDISGETSSTYTLTADDVGRKVRVQVSFTDQLSGMETVTSDGYPASGTVVPIPPTVTISGPSSAVEEGNDLTFTLTLDVAAPTDLTVDVTVAETEDVVGPTDEESRTVTVMEGQTQATFTVATLNDDVDETDSVVTVTVGGDGDTPATYEVGSPSEATATVTDDDERGVVVMPPQLTINEGDTRAYTVVLTSAPTGEVSITPSLSVSNPDVTFTPATLTFTALNWNIAQTVMVTTETDADSDNDTATITHTVAGADYGDNNVTASEVMVTVSEIALPSVTIAASASPVSEGAAAVFILTRTGDNTTNALTVSVTVTQNGEVISGTSPTSVTFDAGATTARLGISTDDDNVDEDAGKVTVMVAMDSANPATYLLGDPATATATVAVEDNDARPVVTLSRSPDTITEAAGMSEIRAMLSNPSAVETRVTVSVPADVLGAVELDVNPPVLVIPAGMTDSANAVTLTAVDNDVEASEDLSVTVSGMAVNTVGVTGPVPVTLTITEDDDTTAPTVTITNVPPTSSAPFTATITFNEVVSGFMVDDITAGNATLSDFSEATPGMVWTVQVTPTADGVVTLMIAMGVATDTAGNGNTAAPQARSIYTAPVTDTMAPRVTITDIPPTSTAPFTATITFNEVVSGFTVGDITVVNATLSGFTEATTGETTPSPVWTVLVTPEMDGPVTLDIAADVVMDAAGNGNLAALQARSTYTAPAMETGAKEEVEEVLSQVVLPEVVQQLTAETTEVITSRLNTITSGSPLGAPPSLSLEDVVADTVAAIYGQREHLENGSLDWRQALSGRDFVWPLSSLNVAQGEGASAQGDHPLSTLALWGGGNYSSYRNIIENTDVDGNGFSGTIGMDLQPIPRLTTGLALTTSRWGLNYAMDATDTSAEEGTYEIGVTMVNPYVNWLATAQLSLWATFGYGHGEVKQNPERNTATTRSDGLTSWAGGVRFEVVPGMDPLTGQGSPIGLAFKGDGATSSFLDTQVQLVRLAAEVSRSFSTDNGLLSTALDLGWSLRSVSDQDNPGAQQQAIADQEDGSGAELAGRLHWLNTAGSVSAAVDARVLLGGGHRREWGVGGYLRFTPSRRNGEGLSLSLQPSFGVTGTRLDELWSLAGNSDLAIHNDPPNARLDAELAYGFPLGNNAILTPYTELTWGETASTYGAGLRYGLNTSLELNLKGTRHQRANGNNDNRLLLDVRSRI